MSEPANPQPGYSPPVILPQAGSPAYPGPAYQPPVYQQPVIPPQPVMPPQAGSPPAYPQPGYQQPAYPPPGYPPPYMAGPQRPPSGGGGLKIGLLIGGIVVAVALIVAGLVFGIPGTGFHGLLPRESPPTLASPQPPPTAPTHSTPPVKSTEAPQATYANGYWQVWHVSPDSLGLTDDDYIWLATITSSTWIIQVTNMKVMSSPSYYLIGVDAQTGAEKWRTTPEPADINCASQPLDDVVYCSGSGRIFSVDPKTGKTTIVTNIFQAGTIKTVDGQVTLATTAEHFGVEVLGDKLVAWDSDYTGQQDFTLISLVEPSGNIVWTNAAPIFASCGSAPSPDVLVDGVLIFNSLCMTGIFDVKTGELLDKPAGYVGVSGPHQLWATIAGPNTTFTSSDGASWTLFGVRGEGDVHFTTSETVAPLAVVHGGNLAWIKPDGSTLWSISLPSTGQQFASCYDGKNLIVTDDDGNTWALSPKDGNILWWNKMIGSTSEGAPDIVILEDGTAMTQWDKMLDAYSVKDGQLYWMTADFWIDTWTRHPGSLTMAGYALDFQSFYRIDPVSPDTSPSSVPPSMLGGWTQPFSQEGDRND